MLVETPIQFVASFLAGGTAGAVAVTMVAPLERVKLILQVQNGASNIKAHQKYKGIRDCFVRIPKEEGFFSFWRGNMASILRCFPYQALNFSLKDVFREHLVSNHPDEPFGYQFLGNLLAGGLAGSCATAFIYPLDYARTRMALDLGPKNERIFRNVRHCLAQTVRDFGFKALYRGLAFSVMGVFIYRALYFGLFDTFMGCVKPEYAHALWVEFPAAEISATTAGIVSYPFDTVRRQMMLQKLTPRAFQATKLKIKLVKYTSVWQCWKNIYQQEGVKGYFHGGTANVLRGTGGAIMLVLYDVISHWILQEKDNYFPSSTSQHRYLHDATLSGKEPVKVKNITLMEYISKPCKIFKERCVFCNF